MYKNVWVMSENPVTAAKEVEVIVNNLEQEGWTSQGGISLVNKKGIIYAFQTIVKNE